MLAGTQNTSVLAHCSQVQSCCLRWTGDPVFIPAVEMTLQISSSQRCSLRCIQITDMAEELLTCGLGDKAQPGDAKLTILEGAAGLTCRYPLVHRLRQPRGGLCSESCPHWLSAHHASTFSAAICKTVMPRPSQLLTRSCQPHS